MRQEKIRNDARRTTHSLSKTALGRFINFPTTIHGIAKAKYIDHPANIQQITVQAFHKFNGSSETYPVSSSSRIGTYKGRVRFEVGVADGLYFNNLTCELAEKLCNSITSRELGYVLDFLIIVTYHYTRKGKKIPLNFDYHQLRCIFNTDELELRLFHSKGTRRMPLDELFSRILNCINDKMKQKSRRSLTFKELHVL